MAKELSLFVPLSGRMEVNALASTSTLSAMLYRVGAFDPTTFAGVTIALALVALLASYIPALRATRADPMIALGHGA